jgi:hypothetical protein
LGGGGIIEAQGDALRITADSGLDTAAGTFTVENFGTIHSTADGQAIDFDDLNSSAAHIAIANHAGGLIQAEGADGIRAGEGAVVTNAGTICVGSYAAGACTGGVIGESHDGVDWQGHGGTLVNETGGVISGQHHGTTSDVDVNVTNQTGAFLIGRNGSGVGSDGTGTVVNRGTISGNWDGLAADGDGDGVDIDLIGDVTNYGVIEGTGARGFHDGAVNTSQGVAMGGGRLDNKAGGVISGAQDGVLVDNSEEGPAFAPTIISNAGEIKGLDGYGIRLVGAQADEISNAGRISGTVKAIDMGGGDDILTLDTGSDIGSIVDGGDGFDIARIVGDVTLGNVLDIEGLVLDAGSLLTLSSDLIVDDLIGALLDGDRIANIAGNGFDYYYNARDVANAYLGGATYLLQGGGRLVAAAVPEPGALALFLPGLLFLLRRRRALSWHPERKNKSPAA